ncbi:SMP-30/gluconolactonase/LRE family protein [soil metagenome]
MTPWAVADVPCHTGEGPLWHPERQILYWTDIPSGALFAYSPELSVHQRVYEGPPVGGMTLQEDGSLLLFRARGNVAIWRDGAETTVLESIPAEEGSRFNDVIADPEGRVFAGTMSTGDAPGRLYRFDLDGSYRVVLEGVLCSNGMGFTPDRKGMYHIDTPTQRIDLFDYDRATGEIDLRRTFVEVPKARGFPDGMTVDADGNVWVAFWDGYALSRYSPEGVETLRIDFPVRKVSSLTLVGNDLYATTAGGDDREANGSLAGSLFHLQIEGAGGVPEFRSRIQS